MGLADLLPDYNSIYRVQAPTSNTFLSDNSKPTNADAGKVAQPASGTGKNASEQASGAAGNAASHLNFSGGGSGPSDAQVFGAGNDAEAAAVMSDKNTKLDIKGVSPEHIAMAIQKFAKPKTNGSMAREGLSNKMKALGK